MKSKAFTLIELLVVIAIIGILATVVLTSLGSARERARDARRQSDIRTIQQALEVYYLEHGKYPTSLLGINIAPNNSWSNSAEASWIALENEMGVNLPEDPTNTPVSATVDWPVGGAYNYAYVSVPNSPGYCYGQVYMLVYNLETEDGTGPDDGVTLCNGTTYAYGNAFVVGVSPQN